jgi:hypothetical protein
MDNKPGPSNTNTSLSGVNKPGPSNAPLSGVNKSEPSNINITTEQNNSAKDFVPISERKEALSSYNQNSKELWVVVRQLSKLKEDMKNFSQENDIHLVTSNNNFSVYVPEDISDDKAANISKRLGIVDRAFNTQAEKFDTMINDSRTSAKRMDEIHGNSTTTFNDLVDKVVNKKKEIVKEYGELFTEE